MNSVDRFRQSMARTEPGSGAQKPDDGLSTVKMRGIPNVSTARLRRSLEFIHGVVHSQQGLHEFDGPRRSLVDQGMKARAISNELSLRGEPKGDCQFCWGKHNGC